MSNRKIKGYGYVPDLADQRDYQFKYDATATLPALVDLRSKMPPVYDQSQLGACVSNAIAAAFQYEESKDGVVNFMPARLVIYYYGRVIEGTVNSDSGLQIRDGIKVVATLGVVDEKLWPYDIAKFKKKPTASIVKQALKNKALTYQRVDNTDLNAAKSALVGGQPIVIGFTVYESFESDTVAKTGMMPMPAKSEQVLGGHAVLVVGYDDSKQCLIVRNSWSASWALGGYFYMPYAYFTNANLVSDCWCINSVN